MRPRKVPAPRRWATTVAALAVVMASAGCTSTPPGNYGQEEGVSRTSPNGQWFGGYIDVTLTPGLRLQDLPKQGSVTTVLSFISAHPQKPCEPTWDGTHTLDEAGGRLDVDAQVDPYRAAGNDVAVSFGGQLGKELSGTCTDTAALVKAYTKVISRYGLDTVDFDVEGTGLADRAAAERRAAAAAKLQAARPNRNPLKVWLTLPVSLDGLTPDGEKSITAMLDAGVDLAGVNIMVMDFEPLDPGKTMLNAATMAAESTHQTLTALYERAGKPLDTAAVWRRMGLTPMIGTNDVKGQTFTLADAAGLNSYAAERGMGRISMWSLNRDKACTASSQPEPGSNASNSCSGTKQVPGKFASVLGKSFTG